MAEQYQCVKAFVEGILSVVIGFDFVLTPVFGVFTIRFGNVVHIGTVVATLSYEDLEIVTQNRIFLEQKAVELVFAHGHSAGLAILGRIVDGMADADADAPDAVQAVERKDFDFHHQLVSAAENAMLTQLWVTLDPITKAIMYAWHTYGNSWAEDVHYELNNHRQLLAHLVDADCARARSAIEAHIHGAWCTLASRGRRPAAAASWHPSRCKEKPT